MRKTLFALLFLLFLLIIACVYQKTYTLYAIQTTEEQEPVVIIHEESIRTIEKEKVTTVVKETPQKEKNTAEKTAVHKKPEEKVQTMHKSTEKQHVVVTPTTTTKDDKKETSFIEKMKTTITETFASKKEVPHTEKIVLVEKVVSHTPEVSKKEMQKVENDAVDYLLTVLKEHKDALGERDEAESRLHALIEKVLEDRKKAIASMEEVAATSATAQATRIEKRDKTSQTIIQNNTKGE
ncbi:MAG: hypothetical protein FAF03_08315 [Epsilonproteobacteria bacterium]|nr:hypothetical protein [Campylobacterota bacterium]